MKEEKEERRHTREGGMAEAGGAWMKGQRSRQMEGWRE